MKYLSSIFLVLIGFNFFIWYWVFAGGVSNNLNLYFLDVGQGDSELIKLPGNVKILIDGGPDKKVLNSLANTLSPSDRYIDIISLSHSQLDHFSGLISVVERYKVGAFVYNGEDGEGEAWKEFIGIIKDKNIPIIVLRGGDSINYKDNKLVFLSPVGEPDKKSELNDTALVSELISSGIKTLFTADVGFDVENYLVKKYDLDVDILKVGHHGSKYSTGTDFLRQITPDISIIEVGKNTYGHPTKETLNKLLGIGSSIYRNDDRGTVHIEANNGKVNVYTSR